MSYLVLKLTGIAHILDAYTFKTFVLRLLTEGSIAKRFDVHIMRSAPFLWAPSGRRFHAPVLAGAKARAAVAGGTYGGTNC